MILASVENPEALTLTPKQEIAARCLWSLNTAAAVDEINSPLLCIATTSDDKKNAKLLLDHANNANYLIIKDNNSLLAGKALDDAILHTAAFMKRHLV